MFKKSVFISQVNSLNAKFATVQPLIRGKLLQTYCCSWYGCQNWDAASKYASQLITEWNKAVRWTLRIPYKTHRNLLPAITQSNSFAIQHLHRLKKFCETFLSSNNDHVLLIGRRAASNTNGALGRNMVRISSFSDMIENDEILAIAESIRDLIEVRDNSFEIDGFNNNDVTSMIEFLCCQ